MDQNLNLALKFSRNEEQSVLRTLQDFKATLALALLSLQTIFYSYLGTSHAQPPNNTFVWNQALYCYH